MFVEVINLYNQESQWDTEKATVDLQERVRLYEYDFDFGIVFEFGNTSIEYAKVLGEIDASIPFFYHAGDDPMQYEGKP